MSGTFELKWLHAEAISAALESAAHGRLPDEPAQAGSIRHKALLRWNICARIITGNRLTPRAEGPVRRQSE